ncbi:unnamed protein product (macronuclear) [Paramecium tetraurelia]|uniref:Uncharacterized protein n=1 Tax=Paramecium tetraurelia TaxID=5888 RepID=A0BGA3_PARTE|nr:uncharacterized protein GSPATT00028605001 [Paramecium tetraurelia]CAK57570.1 unnamed protein product [Paramecium tetraurelia]|eukprot:XP_001424968.1 hypothetical protein (macronuclear) [Paramecium tetraurelia strain d4-2]
MKNNQKGYLELNQIWLSRQEYDAHKKRLQQNSKLSPHKDLRIYEQVKKTQFINNRKRELMKWQTIQEQNTQILARLAKISNRSPTPPSQCGTPRGRRSLKESKLRIENENNRLLSKINGMQGLIKIRQSNLKQENFQDSYLKHKKIQQNMQKFYFDNNLHKIKLRVDAYLDNLNMQKSYERSKSQHVNPRTSKLN